MAEAILNRIATGDQTAVQDCLKTYGGLVWSLARRMLRNSEDAKDVVQEIFVDIWKNAERFDASVRIRHRAPDVPAEVTMLARDRFVVETAEPVWAPAPGQAAVLYDGAECLGGGRLARSAA